MEFAQLCNADKDILCLKYHPLQNELHQEELADALYLEFVDRTNQVGVDVNRAMRCERALNLVQFICGLGPRKGLDLIKKLRNRDPQRLCNRCQLVTECNMGPKVNSYYSLTKVMKLDKSMR